jgi:ABC-type uncharacterized transport system ATPase subunit
VNAQFDSFLEYLRYERNYSEYTIGAYLKDLQQFEDFIENRKEGAFLPEEIDTDIVRTVPGVNSTNKINDEYVISICDDKCVDKLFKCISKFENVMKFSVEEPGLNEIFISIVGDSYDK